VNVVAGTVKLSAEDGRLLQLSSGKFEKADGRWHITAPAAQSPV
jgi:hypothetical protein